MKRFSFGRQAIVLVISLVIQVHTLGSYQDLPCINSSESKPVRLRSKELMKKLDYCVAPILFGGADQKGKVIIEILINSEGKVECIKPRTGPSLLTGSVIKAVRQWTFSPMKSNGKNTWMSGKLTFYLSWDKIWSCPKKDTPK